MRRGKKAIAAVLAAVLLLGLARVDAFAAYNGAKEISLGTVVNDSVDEDTSEKCYRINVKENGYIRIDFSHDSKAKTASKKLFDLAICDTKGNAFLNYSFGDARNKNGQIDKIGLGKGNYLFVLSTRDDCEANYQIKVTFVKNDNFESEPNDERKNAKVIKVGQAISGNNTAQADYGDYFVFVPKETGYYNIGLETNKSKSKKILFMAAIYSEKSISSSVMVESSNEYGYAESDAVKLKAGKKYYLDVDAYSAPAEVLYKVIVNKVQAKKTVITKCKTKGKKAELSWKRVKGCKYYTVYRSTSEKGKYVKVGRVKNVANTSFTDKKVEKNKKYFYKVMTSFEFDEQELSKMSAPKKLSK